MDHSWKVITKEATSWPPDNIEVLAFDECTDRVSIAIKFDPYQSSGNVFLFKDREGKLFLSRAWMPIPKPWEGEK